MVATIRSTTSDVVSSVGMTSASVACTSAVARPSSRAGPVKSESTATA